jgi:DNA (cytosine-5)-methyltransferase 1
LPACSVGAPHKRDRLYFVGHTNSNGCKQGREAAAATRHGGPLDSAGGADSFSRLAHADGKQYQSRIQGHKQAESLSGKRQAGETTGLCDHGFWERHVLIYCYDGGIRVIPVERGLFPLAHGLPNRVGALRGAGNAIVPQVAAEVIKAFMDYVNEKQTTSNYQ